MVKNKVFNSFYGEASENRQVFQVNTYGGHPVSCAVALRNIEIMEAEKLADRAAEMGKYLIDGLRTLIEASRRRRCARQGAADRCRAGEGPRDQGAGRSGDSHRGGRFLQDQGVIVGRSGGGRRHSNTIVLSPPLVITRAECDRLVETLDRALTSLPA